MSFLVFIWEVFSVCLRIFDLIIRYPEWNTKRYNAAIFKIKVLVILKKTSRSIKLFMICQYS